MAFAVKPARLAAPSSTVPRLPTVITVIVVREYSRRREKTTGVEFWAMVLASVAGVVVVVVVAVSCIWKDVCWGSSSRVPVSASASSSDGRVRLVYSIFSRNDDARKMSLNISRMAFISSFEEVFGWD